MGIIEINSKVFISHLLEYYNEEDIMMYYKIPISSSFCNPYRIDNNPSCTVGYVNNRLYFTDWTFQKSYNIVGVACLFYELIEFGEDIEEELYQYALQMMYKDLIKSKNRIELLNLKKTKEKKIIIQSEKKIIMNVKLREWSEQDVNYWFPLPISYISNYYVFPIEYLTINKEIKVRHQKNNMLYGYYFKEYSTKDNEIWKSYKPLVKKGTNEYKEKWFGNCKTHYINKVFDMVNNIKAICTSHKDSLSFKWITGIDSYNYQSESYIPTDILENTKYVVIDNDEAGERFGKIMNEKFGLTIIRPVDKDVFEDLSNYDIELLKKHYLNQCK